MNVPAVEYPAKAAVAEISYKGLHRSAYSASYGVSGLPAEVLPYLGNAASKLAEYALYGSGDGNVQNVAGCC